MVGLHLPDAQQHAMPNEPLAAPSGSASKLLAWLFGKEMKKKLLAEIGDEGGSGIPAE